MASRRVLRSETRTKTSYFRLPPEIRQQILYHACADIEAEHKLAFPVPKLDAKSSKFNKYMTKLWPVPAGTAQGFFSQLSAHIQLAPIVQPSFKAHLLAFAQTAAHLQATNARPNVKLGPQEYAKLGAECLAYMDFQSNAYHRRAYTATLQTTVTKVLIVSFRFALDMIPVFSKLLVDLHLRSEQMLDIGNPRFDRNRDMNWNWMELHLAGKRYDDKEVLQLLSKLLVTNSTLFKNMEKSRHEPGPSKRRKRMEF